MSSSRRVAIAIAFTMLVPLAMPLIPTAAASAGSGGSGPSFIMYPGPPGLSAQSAEPTIGVNWNSGAVMMTVENYVPLNIPPRMGIASINFNDNVNPPTATWISATNNSPGSHGNIDPILFTDSVTGRTWAGGLDGACSVMGMTDTDGATWLPVGNTCAATLDHETIGSGPFAEPLPEEGVAYERIVYYCAQASGVSCAVSYDGGLTFPVTSTVTCGFVNPGLHGSVHVGYDGHAWLPFRDGQGQICVAVTRDNGLTWTGIKIPGTTAAAAGFDPDVATTPGGWTYVGMPVGGPGNTVEARVALSKNDGATWTISPDLGAAYGLKVTTFHEMVAGDDQRAAIAFLGTTTGTAGVAFSSPSFTGVWHLYIAFTYDGGQTWKTVRASDDPVQRGCIWDTGGNNDCRNLLDFMDAQIDAKGRVLVGFADGCTSAACIAATGTPSNSRDSKATIARQTTGKTLFAQYDGASVKISGPVAGVAGEITALGAALEGSAPFTGTINWGDGSAAQPFTTASFALAATHVYATQGTYTITVSMTDAGGATATDTAQASIAPGTGGGGVVRISEPLAGATVGTSVHVSGVVASGGGNRAPVAAFTSSVSGNVASFDATASADPDGDALVFSWEFADGQTATGATASHTYSSPGTYNVCLSVSDGALLGSVCHPVTSAAGGKTLLGTDPEGDAPSPVPVNGNIDEMDIRKLEATTSANGEPVFTVTLKTFDGADPHLGDGGDGAQWQVEWNGPQGIDFVSLNAALTTSSCQWGFYDTDLGLYSGQGSAVCTTTSGSPGTITITYPASAMGTRGYTGSETLANVKVTTGVYQGTPQDVSIWAGGTTPVDDMNAETFELPGTSFAFANIGLVRTNAAKAAPAAPPADPEVTDKVADPIGDNVPTTNIQSAWFDSDADNLYVGMKIQDVPADTSSTGFIFYAVNFKPSWAPADATWNGSVTSGRTLTGLRAFALYSPVRGAPGLVGVPSSDTATVFELQALSTDGTRSFFGTVDRVTGSISPTTDILWWTIPRTLLQVPAGGDLLETTSANTAPAVGNVVTGGSAYGDSTGTGRAYAFPSVTVDPPVVTLTPTPASGPSPLPVTFATSVVASGAIASWEIVYGDTASASGAGSVPATFTHTYSAPGTYTATLTVTDTGGRAGTGQTTVTAADGGPAGSGVYVSAGGLPPVQATCTNGCETWSADLDLSPLDAGAVSIAAALLEDGETVSSDAVSVTLVKQTGIIIDVPSQGQSAEPGLITVSGRRGSVNDARPHAIFDADPVQGVAPLAVTFTLDGTDDKGIASWTLAGGDGFSTSGSTLPSSPSHTYTSAGTYTATYTVTDTRGQQDTTTITIQVQATNTPPTAPHAPSPANGATNVALAPVLTWAAEDADGNTLTYDVFLDAGSATTLVATGQTASYMPTGLLADTVYSWRVVAKDGTDETSGPVWTFRTRQATQGEVNKPHVVVAVIDSGTSPYHQQFRRGDLVESPATYISGFPTTNVVELDLCFYDPATKTVSQSRCPASVGQSAAADLAQWQKFGVSPAGATGAGQGKIAWIPGTNVLLVSFAHNGDSNYPALDGALGAGDSHGSHTSSHVGGLTTGTCPECIVVVIEGDSVAGIEDAYRWAANQPWIDVITSSVSIGLIGLGWNPNDFFEATSASTKLAVQNGKIVFEAAGNGIANAGAAPTSTFLYANSNPWTIPVGCSAELTAQMCAYSDFPNPITASGISRIAATVDSFAATEGAGGTSFSSPSSAGVAARTLYALRTAMGDTGEGPATTAGKSLVRIAGTPPATGPMANGILTKLELEEAIFKTARRDLVPKEPNYIFPVEVPNTPLNFVKEGYGNVYAGDWGVGYANAVSTWSSSADAAAVLLGTKALPNRWVEETYWEQIVEPVQKADFGADVPETDADAWPMNDAPQPGNVGGYQPSWDLVDPNVQASATIADGALPSPTANRLYLHHNNMGPDPASPVNNLYEYYLNSVADPSVGISPCNSATCPDQTGIGGTGVGTAGKSLTYVVSHPSAGTLVLDSTKDVVVHVEAVNYAGAPSSSSSLTMTLTTEDGAFVGTASPTLSVSGTRAVYEARFKPAVGILKDPIALTVTIPGPVFSTHIQSRGASWIELPIVADIGPTTGLPITYYLDDYDSKFTANGDTIPLTRDVTKLAGDADGASIFPVPQVNGVVINLQSEDVLSTSKAIVGGSGSAHVYVCTAPFIDVGAATFTVKVALAAGATPIGGGSLTTTLAGIHGADETGLTVPLTLFPAVVQPNVPLTGSITVSAPGNVVTPNVGFCGGGAAHPMSIDLTIAQPPLPSASIDSLPAILTGTVTLAGNYAAAVDPDANQVVWYATNMSQWSGTVSKQGLALDTSLPTAGNGGPIGAPQPTGITGSFRSVRPVASDAAALSPNGVGTAQFWVAAIGAAADVTVDMTVLLESPSGATRLLGSGSLTKHIVPPLGTVAPAAHQKFVIDFVPKVLDPQPNEKLLFVANVHNAGAASTSQATVWAGGPDRPIFVSLPRAASTTPADTNVVVTFGNAPPVTVPAANGRWSTTFDTRSVDNGARSVSVVPAATYAGVVRNGLPVGVTATVQNALNTAPTATLGVTPITGIAPFEATATLTGSDAETPADLLTWSLDWGDGTAVATGSGGSATRTHNFVSVGTFTVRLTVTDGGGLVATRTQTVTAVAPPPVERILVDLDGSTALVATDDSTDGSLTPWHATFDVQQLGAHTITARHMRDDTVLSSASVDISIANAIILSITDPSDDAIVAPGAALSGGLIYNGTATGVDVSLDPTFATGVVAATSSDGFKTWTAPIDGLALPEDVATQVYARATTPEGDAVQSTTVTLDAAPNPRIDVLSVIPARTGEGVDLQGYADPSASGAAIAALAWSLGDGATSTDAAVSHAYTHSGVYAVTLTATDELGRTGTATQDIRILNRAPTLGIGISPTTPTDLETVTATLAAADADGTVVSTQIQAFDTADRSGNVIATGIDSLSVQFPDDGTYLILGSATDNEGDTAEFEALLYVANVRPTALLTASPALVGQGAPATFDASGSSDPDGSIAEYRFDFGDGSDVVVQPQALVSHEYEGTGLFLATVTVVDDDGSEVGSAPFEVKVNGRPILANVGNKVVSEGQTLSFTLSATDPEGDALTYSLNTTPPGASFDTTTGAFTWTPTFAQQGTYYVQFGASDGLTTATRNSILSVGNVPLPPTLDPIGAKSGIESSFLGFTLTASDPDTPASELVFSAIGLPAGAMLLSTGEFGWTPDFTQDGTYPVTFSVTDGDFVISELVTITIANLDRAPTLDAFSGASKLQLSTIVVPLKAADPDGDLITFSVTQGPAGMTVVDLGGGNAELRWTPQIGQVGAFPATVTASAGEASASRSATFTAIFNTSLTLTPQGPSTLRASPGQTVKLTAVLKNTGPQVDTFGISILNNVGWTITSAPAPITLVPGATATVTVDVIADGAKPVSWTTITAKSLGDGITKKETKLRVDIPVVVSLAVDDVVVGDETVSQAPSGRVTLKHLDGTLAVGATVTVTQTPQEIGLGIGPALKSVATGETDDAGVFAFDFGGEPGGTLPGVHQLVIVAKKPSGFESVLVSSYTIVAEP